MTYYEELDLPPTASTDEIRHSYKALARLLHPDQCNDTRLKRLAELQMRRLNQILAVLTDAQERRRYDAGLRVVAAPPRPYRGPVDPGRISPPPRLSLWHRPWFPGLCAWLPAIAGLFVFVAALTYYESGASLPAVLSGTVSNSAEERIPAEPALLPARPADAAAGHAGFRPSAFAGNWISAPPMRETAEDGAAESAELRVSELAGVLRGSYQARYRVRDGAPEVVFDFEGTARDASPQLFWTGPGGSRGKVRLRLLSADQLQVIWTASRLGALLDFPSGTAELIRQQESGN